MTSRTIAVFIVLAGLTLAGCAASSQGGVSCSTLDHVTKVSKEPGLSVTWSAAATLTVTNVETGEVLEPESVTDGTVNEVPIHVANFPATGSGQFTIDIRFPEEENPRHFEVAVPAASFINFRLTCNR